MLPGTGVVGALSSGITTRPVSMAVISAVLLIAALAWVTTRSQAQLRKARQVEFPYYAPLEIALVGYLVNSNGIALRLYSSVRRFGGSLFGLTSRHQVIAKLPDADRFMANPHRTLDTIPHEMAMMTRIFGWEGSTQVVSDIIPQLISILERVFLNDSASTAATERANVPAKASSFVTFSTSPILMQRWERSADIRLILDDGDHKENQHAVEASFQKLTRDFGACIAIPQLYGQDFLDRHPRLLEDFWAFDNELFPMLMVGVPPWAPLRAMRAGLAARARLRNAMEGLFRRIDQFQKGQAVDFDADMSDVGTVALERNKLYADKGLSYAQRGDSDLLTLWAQNANTQPVLFWFLTFIYSSSSSLLEDIRNEVMPFVTLASGSHSLSIAALDIPGITRSCPVTKAALYETYRLCAEATSIRQVARPLTVRDHGDVVHILQPGTYVSLLHAASQMDSSVYPDPDKFVADRFLADVDKDDNIQAVAGQHEYGKAKKTRRKVARYGSLRPWGAGPGICKGRSFAEKELLAAAAAIVTLWDVRPAAGAWKVPGMSPGTGVKKPVEDIRVVISRRKFSEAK